MAIQPTSGSGPRRDVIAPGRVAVVTGAASGIGLGMAERFAAEGMHVVMADVEGPVLSRAASELAGGGASVLPVGTDVADRAAVGANFGTSARNRPSWAGPPTVTGPAERASAEQFDRLAATGASPAEVARIVADGIRSARFYILTSANRNGAVLRRGEEILSGRPPAPPFP